MYNKQVCENSQQRAKNRETIIFLLNNPTLNTILECSYEYENFNYFKDALSNSFNYS